MGEGGEINRVEIEKRYLYLKTLKSHQKALIESTALSLSGSS